MDLELEMSKGSVSGNALLTSVIRGKQPDWFCHKGYSSTHYNHGEQKSISACTKNTKPEVDELQQQKSISDFTSVSRGTGICDYC